MSKILFCFLIISSSVYSQTTKIDSDYQKMLLGYYDKDFPTISTEDLQNKLDKKEAVLLLDTREFTEFEIGHIPTAICTGYDNFDWKKLKNIGKDKQIVVYCSVGYRSQEIAKKLRAKGFKNVVNLYGGIFLWVNQDRKIVDSANKSSKKIHGYSKDWAKWVKSLEVVY